MEALVNSSMNSFGPLMISSIGVCRVVLNWLSEEETSLCNKYVVGLDQLCEETKGPVSG